MNRLEKSKYKYKYIWENCNFEMIDVLSRMDENLRKKLEAKTFLSSVWLNFQSVETFSYVEIIYIFYSIYTYLTDLTLSFCAISFNFSLDKHVEMKRITNVKHRVWNWKLNIFINGFVSSHICKILKLCCFLFFLFISTLLSIRSFLLFSNSSCVIFPVT